MVSLKTPTTASQQILILQERGMAVDESQAKQWLASVSYYRLSGYWYPYRVLPPSADTKKPRRLDEFEPGTNFSEIARLYEFDRKLRTIIHDGMERIEVALRARIGELLVAKGNPLSYQDSSLFRAEFDHEKWLETALKRVERAQKRNQSIQHYSESYESYPFWVLAEVLDFSDISLLFEGLPAPDQHEIAQSFGFNVALERLNAKQRKSYYNQNPLARWCEQLTVLRNTCAHHGRVWNRHLTPASTNAFRTVKELSSLPKGQSDRLFGALLVMSFLVSNISPRTTWPHKVRALIEDEYLPLSARSVTEMGLPDGWQNLGLWAEPEK